MITANPHYDSRSAKLCGLRFGEVIVARLVGSTGNGRLWECRCDCGKMCEKTTGALQQKRQNISCGCSRYRRADFVNGQKACRKCKRVQPIQHFVMATNNKNGRASICYDCHRAETRTGAKRYYREHGVERRQYAADYKKKHPNALLEWRRKNPAKANNAAHRRRAKLMSAPIGNSVAIVDWEQGWRSKRFAVCFWCRKRTPISCCHSDHIIAINNGGAHSVENLCISCNNCNCRKGFKTVNDWNLEIKEPILL